MNFYICIQSKPNPTPTPTPGLPPGLRTRLAKASAPARRPVIALRAITATPACGLVRLHNHCTSGVVTFILKPTIVAIFHEVLT